MHTQYPSGLQATEKPAYGLLTVTNDLRGCSFFAIFRLKSRRLHA
jgi:hypothetical protein